MATRTDKERFFAQLERLDESTETESESDLDRRPPRDVSRKRQRLSEDAKPKDTTPVVTITITKPVEQKRHSVKPPAQSGPSVLKQAQIDGTAQEDNLTVRNSEKKPLSRSIVLSGADDVKPICRESRIKMGLFQGLTFYLVPNDDVAKPRKLRIQSAVSQGALWARKLDSSITHVIVDPDITASAVVKFMKDQIETSNIAFVKMNWLIESLSHKSVRNPEDSRFRLKGANAAFVKTQAQPPPRVTSIKERVGIEDCINETPNMTSASLTNIDDEFGQIVQSMKTAPHLPFDEEMDLDNLLSFSSGDEQTDEMSSRAHTKGSTSRKPSEDQPDGQQYHSPTRPRDTGFQCMQSNPSNQAPCPNDRTISILQQMATYYDRTGNNWRTLAYRRAINALRKQKMQITTAKQARAIHGIGTRLADKVEEITTTDRLRRLDAVLSSPEDAVLQLFMGVYGAGLRQARTWMEQGHRTLDDLLQHAKLSPNQKIGVEHHADFAQRIPRAEVKQHGDIVAQALRMTDKDLQAIIGGSYRRGMPDSGDIDVIITHPTATLPQLQTWVFDAVVPHLSDMGFMKHALATSRPNPSTPRRQPINPSLTSTDNPPHSPSSRSTTTGTKFLGASQLPPTHSTPRPPWRRIDLLLVPPQSLGAALLYFTGNDIFNRSLRLLASKKGMRLNQHGLYKDVMRGKGRVKITEGELVEGRSERRIFEILGVPWREAEDRRC